MPERADGVQSVARAVALMECFADAESGLTLTELAGRTGLNVSTAHRLIGTLCRTGMLCRDSSGDRFILGPLLTRLSRSAVLTDDLADIAMHLDALVEQTGETACFGVRVGETMTVHLVATSPQPLRVEVRVGSQVPLSRSAMGHALLAGAESLDDAAASLEDPPDDLRVDLLATQFRGFAVRDEDGVRGIACAIRAGGVARAAIELRGPASRMGDADALGRILVAHAGDVGRLPAAATL